MIVALLIFLVFLYWTGYWLLLKGHLPLTDRALVGVGTLLMTVATLVPFLIVIRVVESTFFLNYLSYEFILLGMMYLVLGVGGLGRCRTPPIEVADLEEYRRCLRRLKQRSEIEPFAD